MTGDARNGPLSCVHQPREKCHSRVPCSWHKCWIIFLLVALFVVPHGIYIEKRPLK